MKTIRTFRHELMLSFVVAVVAGISLLGFVSITHAQDADEVEPVTLEVGSAFPEGALESHGLELLRNDLLEEFTNGTIQFDYRGGPESFPPFELYSFVQRGAIDIANLPSAFYMSEEPRASALNFAELPPWELRDEGIYEFFNEEIFNPRGLKHLGRAESGLSFHCYTQDRVEEPEDLEGMDIRSAPNYRPMLEHFGANPVEMPPGEIFTALERGVVEGFCWPAAGLVVPMEWYKQVNYVIDPGFNEVEVHLLMNLDSWNNLSADQQQLLERAVKVMERQMHHYGGKQALQDRQLMVEQGLEVIEFTGEARERFLRGAYAPYWRMLIEQAGSADTLARLATLLENSGVETYFPRDFAEEYEGN